MVPKRSIPCRPPPMMRINIMVGRTLPCWRTDSRRTRCSLHSRARASISMQSRSSWRKYGSCPSRSPSIFYWPGSATKLPCCSDAACAPQDKSLRSALARRAVRCTARFYVHMHRASRYIAHMMSWPLVDEAIGAATGVPIRAQVRRPGGGGCVNQAFAVEADGLAAILASRAIRVPRPVCWGSVGDDAYLVLEHLSFGGTRADGMQRLGAGLAAMHRCTGARYGWHRDNTIGTTPQCNETSDDWVTFWRARRLRFQLQCAAARGCGAALWQKGERLLEMVDALLHGHVPAPSLLHGELWSGNYAILDSGVPVIFDPAVYYGDRETDLAMTELFGGYSREFYEAYHAHYPLADGYPLRKILYNLYHVLNHYNLFGGGYAGQAGRMRDRLLSETN